MTWENISIGTWPEKCTWKYFKTVYSSCFPFFIKKAILNEMTKLSYLLIFCSRVVTFSLSNLFSPVSLSISVFWLDSFSLAPARTVQDLLYFFLCSRISSLALIVASFSLTLSSFSLFSAWSSIFKERIKPLQYIILNAM